MANRLQSAPSVLLSSQLQQELALSGLLVGWLAGSQWLSLSGLLARWLACSQWLGRKLELSAAKCSLPALSAGGSSCGAAV